MCPRQDHHLVTVFEFAPVCVFSPIWALFADFLHRVSNRDGAENRKMLGTFFCITKTRFTQDRFVHRTVSGAQIYTLEVPGSGTKRQLAVDLVSTRRVACGRERWPGASRNSNSVTAGISQACTLKRWCQNHCDLPQNTPVFVVFPPWCQQTRCYFQYSLVRMMVLVQKTLATCCFPQSPPMSKTRCDDGKEMMSLLKLLHHTHLLSIATRKRWSQICGRQAKALLALEQSEAWEFEALETMYKRNMKEK